MNIKQCTNLTSRPILEAATWKCLVKMMFSLTGLLDEKVILAVDCFFPDKNRFILQGI